VSLSRRERVIAAAVAVGLLSAACVSQGDPTVGVSKVSAKLVFGVKPETTPPPLPTQSLSDVLKNAGDGSLLPFDFGGYDNGFDIPTDSGPSLSAGACPTAPHNASIEVPTEANVAKPPAEGLYKWQAFRTLIAADGKETKGPVKFVQRAVRRVKSVSPTEYTFETLEPAIDGTFVNSTWQVKSEAVSPNVTQPQGVVAPPRVGEPERGMVLKKQVVLDERGSEAAGSRPFDPATGLLVLPLPVVSGENFQTAAVDRKTGDTLVADTNVRERETVDACGKRTSGWAVDASQSRTLTSDPAQSQQLLIHYVVATQFGGLVVRQVTEFTGSDGKERLTVTLADLTPQPLPAALK
jgi:hypothetical protein